MKKYPFVSGGYFAQTGTNPQRIISSSGLFLSFDFIMGIFCPGAALKLGRNSGGVFDKL
jgi:hypothetical protein